MRRASEVIGKIRSLMKKSSADQPTPLEVNEVIREVLKLTEHQILRSGIALQIDLGVDIPPRTRRPRATAAGAAEPDHERRGSDDGERGRARAAGQLATTRRQRGRGCDSRFGKRYRSRTSGSAVPAVLHDEAGGDGNGPVDQPLAHRGARRKSIGHGERGPRDDVPLLAACIGMRETRHAVPGRPPASADTSSSSRREYSSRS